MPGLSLRPYRRADQPEIVRLHMAGLKQMGVPVDEHAAVWDSDLDEIERIYLPGGAFVMAVWDDRTVGMGALRRVDDSTGEVKRMRVYREWQGRGVGTRILAYLWQEAVRLGYDRLVLDALESNDQARRFYENRGFRLTRRSTISGFPVVYYQARLSPMADAMPGSGAGKTGKRDREALPGVGG